MKKRTFLVLLSILICTCSFAEDKILKASGFGVSNDQRCFFEPADPQMIPAIPPSSIAVNCTEDGIVFDLLFENASRSDTMELFFQPDTLTGRQEYYQFFGRIFVHPQQNTATIRSALEEFGVPWCSNMEILPYYYTHTTAAFPYLRNYSVETVLAGKNAEVRIFIPWSDLAAARPFDENGKGGLWRLNAVRNTENSFSCWQGKHHRPATWGLLKLPDLAPSDAKKLYRKAALAICEKPWLESFRFDRKSLARGRASLAADLQKRKEQTPSDAESLTVDQWAALIRDLRQDASGRRFLAAAPDPMNKKWNDPAWKVDTTDMQTTLTYTFDRPVLNGWIINFSAQGAGKTKLPVTVSVDDQRMPENARNWHFGPVSKGSVLKLTVTNGKNRKLPWCRFKFTLEELGRDLVPCPPMELLFSAPLESMPVLSPDGTVYAPHLSRHLPQCICLLTTRPRVVWFGESMLDGLGFTEPHRKFNADFSSEECGIVADNPRKVLWRLENGVFSLLKPEYIVLSFDSRPTVDEDVQTIEKIVDGIHAQTPGTKIFLLSELPSRRDLKFSEDLPFVKMNRFFMEMEKKRPYLHYLDVTAGFYDANGDLQMDHYTHVYFALPVYQTWCDTVRKALETDGALSECQMKNK